MIGQQSRPITCAAGCTMTRKLFIMGLLVLLATSASVLADDALIEEVRLVGRGRRDRGRVEVKLGGEWGTVCDDEWDHRDARVVCTTLGLQGGVAYGKAYYGRGRGRIVVDSVQCQGDEDNLNQCTLGLSDGATPSPCTHQEDAGVRCGLEPPPSTLVSSITAQPLSPLSTNCAINDGRGLNVRLVGSGQLPASGLVQVRDPASGNGDFGFVCDDNWNIVNARVVCKELCFDPSLALPGWQKPVATQLPSQPRIVLDDVRCVGSERSLLDCRHQPWNTHDCSSSELAAVTCSTANAIPQVPKAELACEEETMVVTFRRALNPSLQTDGITRGDGVPTACSPRVWQDRDSIKVSLPYRLCAQLKQDEKGVSGNLTLESRLLVPLAPTPVSGNPMSRVSQYIVKLQCRLAGQYSASRTLPGVQQPVLPASGQTKLPISMLMYSDDTFTKPSAGQGLVLTPGGWINLGLSVNTRQQIKLVVTSCFVGPDPSDSTKPRQALLLDKCAQEDTVSTYTINDTFWGIRFQPFSFLNFTDVTVDCQAFACKNDVTSGKCDRSCNAAINKHNTQGTASGRRQRRRRSRNPPRVPRQQPLLQPAASRGHRYITATLSHSSSNDDHINIPQRGRKSSDMVLPFISLKLVSISSSSSVSRTSSRPTYQTLTRTTETNQSSSLSLGHAAGTNQSSLSSLGHAAERNQSSPLSLVYAAKTHQSPQRTLEAVVGCDGRPRKECLISARLTLKVDRAHSGVSP